MSETTASSKGKGRGWFGEEERKRHSVPKDRCDARVAARGHALGTDLQAVSIAKGLDCTIQARPLQASAKLFGASLLWESEVEVSKFVEACQRFCEVLALMGSWTAPMAAEVHRNIELIRAASSSGFGPSLQELLQSEVAQDTYKQRSALAYPSAATGILSSWRCLALWSSTLRGCALAGQPVPKDALKRSMEAAYETHFKPDNGCVTRNAFTVDTSLMPDWEDTSAKLATSAEQLRADIGTWVAVMDEMLPRIEASLAGLDLVDARATW